MFTSGAVEMNRQATANLLFIGLGAGRLSELFSSCYVPKGRKYDVVVLDACLVDMSYEFNCPIKQFLERKHLENVSKLMTEKGPSVVLVNVLSFKMFEVLAAEKVKSVYEKVFRHCTAQRAKDSPPNMVQAIDHGQQSGLIVALSKVET
ncbi:hypothetical protein OSTOST_15083 [Ostertagia ostertagi]